MVGFDALGWAAFAPDPAGIAWAETARSAALEAVADPAFAQWHQCAGTWFVGLDALANDAQGRVAGSAPLGGPAVDFLVDRYGALPDLHRAQISVVYPGYPKPREGETEAGFRYRLNRDAAHVDGILGLGTPKRRFVREPHAFVLGLPLSEADTQAAPMVVWEGSHLMMQEALRPLLQGAEPDEVDITETYVATRKRCFEECPRRIVHVPVGGAYVLHRLALHGVAPWGETAVAAEEGRMIAYFRPEVTDGTTAWINAA